MIAPIRPACQAILIAVGLALAACASKPAGEMPAASAQPVAAPAASAASAVQKPAAPPINVHEASAQCWMKYDTSTASLDARAKLVDKCIDEKMKAAKGR